MARLESQYNPLLKSFPDSEKINAVSEGAEVLYLRLLAQTDDAGRYYGDAKFVCAKLFTARLMAKQVDASKMEKRLIELEEIGLLRRYKVAGMTYLELIGPFKSLRSDRTAKVRFPEMTYAMGTNDVPLRAPIDRLYHTNTHTNTHTQNNTHTQSPDPSSATDAAGEILAVFDHYRTHHPKSFPKPSSRSKEWTAIRSRLVEGYTVEQLKLAIDGNHKSPFHCGQNEQGRKYHALELTMRDGGKVANFIEHAESRAGPVLSEKSRRTKAAIESYLGESNGPSDEETLFNGDSGTL